MVKTLAAHLRRLHKQLVACDSDGTHDLPVDDPTHYRLSPDKLGANRYVGGSTTLDHLYRDAGLDRLDRCDLEEIEASHGGTGVKSKDSFPRDELAVVTLAQFIPFSDLSRTVKQIIYSARTTAKL